MYQVSRDEHCIMVELKQDFDYGILKEIIYNEIMISDAMHLHDIWLVGQHRAHLRLGELQNIVDDFRKLCPKGMRHKKSAIVVDPGLTEAILKLLADGIQMRLPITCRTFRAVDEARNWIGGNTIETS